MLGTKYYKISLILFVTITTVSGYGAAKDGVWLQINPYITILVMYGFVINRLVTANDKHRKLLEEAVTEQLDRLKAIEDTMIGEIKRIQKRK